MKKKRALILGIGGQDGSYLAETLLKCDYEVHGLYRHSSVDNLRRIRHLIGINRLNLHKGDLIDTNSVLRVISNVSPDEIYNEADQDNVGWSYVTPTVSSLVTHYAPVNILDRMHPEAVKFFQPLSATMFGSSEGPQNEQTVLSPDSPYAIAKANLWRDIQRFRDRGYFISTAIYFNHDSIRRGPDYLLQTICRQALAVKSGELKHLSLGNLDTQVDIGWAPDYMEAAHRIMSLEEPDDFVIGTGRGTSIGALATYALTRVGLEPGRQELIKPNLEYWREDAGNALIADITKANKTFGFQPTKFATDVIDLILDCHQQHGYQL